MTIKNMKRHQWADDKGHTWPITGHWCEACGLPLIPVNGNTTHPCCEETR